MFHDVQVGGLQGVLTSVHSPPSVGYPQHMTADPPKQPQQQKVVRMLMMCGPFVQCVQSDCGEIYIIMSFDLCSPTTCTLPAKGSDTYSHVFKIDANIMFAKGKYIQLKR